MRQALICCLLTILPPLAQAENHQVLMGYVEKATLLDKNLSFSAKMDTGAKTASLNATDIKKLKKDGVDYVSFKVPTKKGDASFEKKVVREVRIKVRSAEKKQTHLSKSIRRPVVMFDITLGNQSKAIEVNLANRSRFLYPLLLGRKAIIKYNGIIDPSRKFILKTKHSAD